MRADRFTHRMDVLLLPSRRPRGKGLGDALADIGKGLLQRISRRSACCAGGELNACRAGDHKEQK